MNLKNYLICTFLHSYRQTFPFALMKKNAFFKKYEAEFKHILERGKWNLGVLFEDEILKIDSDLSAFPNKNIVSWILMDENDFIFAYTKSSYRKKGKATRLMNQMLLRHDLGNFNEIIMKFYTPNGFNFLKSEKWRGGKEFNIYVA